VELLKVVAKGVLFHNTWSPDTKFVPLTVNVKLGPPAMALAGDSEPIVGTGAALIAKLRALEFAPLGGCTTTDAVPTLAINPPGTEAVNCDAETKFVESAAPFHSKTSPTTKLLPIANNVNPGPPAVVLGGERELSIGAGSGAGADIFNVTVSTAGEPCAPVAVTVT
jgi:hypothetical protein